MIPIRRRAALPPGHWWIAHKRAGFLVVTLSVVVPVGSDREQELVKRAIRAWRHHQRRGLVLLPAPIAGGAGLAWLVRQFRRPTVAAGAAVTAASVVFGAVTLLPSHVPNRTPTAAEPPARSTAPAPKHTTVPHHPAAPPRPGLARPRASQPHVVAAISTSHVRVDPARLPVRLPVRVSPVHATPPRLPDPPVKLTPPPTVTATDCRLLRLELKVVRVCR